MWIRRLSLRKFRGIASCDIDLSEHCAIVGPNGCGKSTVIDALALLFGRSKLVRMLTENDFYGGAPTADTRILIIATIVGFEGNDPAQNTDWFRLDRAVIKWITSDGKILPKPVEGAQLCAQIAYCARFDLDELHVEQMTLFYDPDADIDPFADEGQTQIVPPKLLSSCGFFVLPARRTWEGAVSFNSELFRRIVSDVAGIPSAAILEQRDALRNPTNAIEQTAAFKPLVASINKRLSRLVSDSPEFKLRMTAADSEAVFQALLPHYTVAGTTLPVSRHGAGLLSLQTLLLLLEIGKIRQEKKLNFILALEEPELHLAPGLQGRLVAEAMKLSTQTLTTTHSPKVASLHPQTDILLMTRGQSTAPPLLATPLAATASNNQRKLFGVNRTRLVESLMHPFVLVAEGKLDSDWMGRLCSLGEDTQTKPPFSSIYGIAPTEDAAVVFTSETIGALRGQVIALVDGDAAGDAYVKELLALAKPPTAIVQWPVGCTIEDVVGWLAKAGDPSLFASVQGELPSWTLKSLAELVNVLKTKNDKKTGVFGLKDDLIVHDQIVAILGQDDAVVARAGEVLDALVALAQNEAHPRIPQAKADIPHYRFTFT